VFIQGKYKKVKKYLKFVFKNNNTKCKKVSKTHGKRVGFVVQY